MATIHLNFRSDALWRAVYPLIFLPDLNGWRDTDPPWPTVYFLNGYSGGGLETAAFAGLRLFAMRYGVAVVLPDGDNSFYVDNPDRRAMYSRYVGEELVETTRFLLPLSRKREDTFIAGISMAGYGALINGLRFSKRFSKIGMLSPALNFMRKDGSLPPIGPERGRELRQVFGSWEQYSHSYMNYLNVIPRMVAEGADIPELFLAIGDQDPLRPDAEDFREKVKGLPLSLSWFAESGGHDHTFWKKAMDPLFSFLTGKEGV